MIRKDSDASPWNIGRVTLYGAAIGAVAAGFKLLAPESLVSWGGSHSAVADAEEIVGASLAFALLCGLAAAARNFIVRRLVSPQIK
jgi:hypothetical protein